MFCVTQQLLVSIGPPCLVSSVASCGIETAAASLGLRDTSLVFFRSCKIASIKAVHCSRRRCRQALERCMNAHAYSTEPTCSSVMHPSSCRFFDGRCRPFKSILPSLHVLSSTISRCQLSVERCKVDHSSKPAVRWTRP